MNERDVRQGDRVLTQAGWGTVIAIFNNDPNKVGYIRVQPEKQVMHIDVHKDEVTHEGFPDFMTRPTGFGKTPWPQFWMIQVFPLLFIVTGIATWSEHGWIGIVAAVAIEAALVYGTYQNWTRRWV